MGPHPGHLHAAVRGAEFRSLRGSAPSWGSHLRLGLKPKLRRPTRPCPASPTRSAPLVDFPPLSAPSSPRLAAQPFCSLYVVGPQGLHTCCLESPRGSGGCSSHSLEGFAPLPPQEAPAHLGTAMTMGPPALLLLTFQGRNVWGSVTFRVSLWGYRHTKMCPKTPPVTRSGRVGTASHSS